MCSRRSGSTIGIDPAAQAKIVRETGMAFLFAPSHHPCHAPRDGRTPGPRVQERSLTSSARSPILLGLTHRFSESTRKSRRGRSCGSAAPARGLPCDGRFGSGLDEITVTGETSVTELYGGRITNYTLAPEQFGAAGPHQPILRAATRRSTYVSSVALGREKGVHATSCS